MEPRDPNKAQLGDSHEQLRPDSLQIPQWRLMLVHLLDPGRGMVIKKKLMNIWLVGGWATPLKKNEGQLGWLFPIYGKIKNVPNHQPVGNVW